MVNCGPILVPERITCCRLITDPDLELTQGEMKMNATLMHPKGPYNYAEHEHGLAHFQEIELFYFYPEQRNGGKYAYLLYDTVNMRGICWCRDEWAAHALLSGSGYEYRKWVGGGGCWYPTEGGAA